VTSQIFANIYLNEFDQFIKHQLKVKYYFRYADDFIIVHQDENYLQEALVKVDGFIKNELGLKLHPQKIQLRKLRQGIDFLGYIILPRYVVLRVKTRRRIFKKIRCNLEKLKQGSISKESFNQSLQSYYGILKHCCGYKAKAEIKSLIGFK